MTAAIFGHPGPWTEEEFLALGETPDRVELFDGSLSVTPAPTPRHQRISSELYVVLSPAAEAAGLHVLEAINLRLRPGRIPIPDLVITDDIDFDQLVIDASAVRLVCEIISPSNPSADRVLKMHFYAQAGIPWYLLVEQRTGELHLYRREGDHYLEHSITRRGQVLRLVEPVTAEIDPERLLPPT
ncbi:Uma2 family endonuclease [Plantactinospora siamensis]|uniref:Uma2 family endonuclease n=1 Tax=Plantactinospora siamensis TaxID=555372 RepID=A0ABV6NY37_9ACTN